MAITIDWGTKVISVPQADLTFISGALYDMDTNAFRLALKSLEDDEDGMPYPKTHTHNTEVTVAGVTFARTIEIINGFSVTFEDTGSAYAVRFVGSNNNIWDAENGILNITAKVSYIPTNSAGLISTGTSGLTASEAAALLNIDTEVTILSDGVFGQKVLQDSSAPATKPGYMTLWDELGVLLGHKEIFEEHVLAGDAANKGYTKTGRGISYEGPITAGLPPP